MKLTVSQCRKWSGFLNESGRHVRNHEILLVQVTVVSVVVRSFPRQKTNKLKFAKQCGRQASKIKTQGFEIFLKWRHSSPMFHYAVNFIRRGQSGKFKAWFYGKKHQNSLFFGLKTFLYVIEIAIPVCFLWQCWLTRIRLLKTKEKTSWGLFKGVAVAFEIFSLQCLSDSSNGFLQW